MTEALAGKAAFFRNWSLYFASNPYSFRKERVQGWHGMGITVSYYTPGGIPYVLMTGECHGPKTKRSELGNCTVSVRFEFHSCTVLSGGQLDLGEMYLD